MGLATLLIGLSLFLGVHAFVSLRAERASGWAVLDRISLKARSDPGAPPIPVGGLTNDFLAVIVGTVVYLALAFVFHPAVISVPVFGS